MFADSWNQPDGKESTIENLQRKIRRLESELEKRPEKKDAKDDREKVFNVQKSRHWK